MLGPTDQDQEAVEAVAAPCHRWNQQQPELVASAGTHKHRAHVCTTYTHTAVHTEHRHTEHSHKHRQQKQPCTASICSWGGWRFASENIFMHMNLNTYLHMYNMDLPQKLALTLSFPSSCAWIPVSLFSSTWAYKPLALQPLSSCWCRPAHSHTRSHTNTQSWLGAPGTLYSPDSHPYRHTRQQALPLHTLDTIASLETAGIPLVSQGLGKSHFILGSHSWSTSSLWIPEVTCLLPHLMDFLLEIIHIPASRVNPGAALWTHEPLTQVPHWDWYLGFTQFCLSSPLAGTQANTPSDLWSQIYCCHSDPVPQMCTQKRESLPQKK